MGVAMALGVGQIDKDRADPYRLDFEAVAVTVDTHQVIGCAVFGFVGKLELFLASKCTVRPRSSTGTSPSAPGRESRGRFGPRLQSAPCAPCRSPPPAAMP